MGKGKKKSKKNTAKQGTQAAQQRKAAQPGQKAAQQGKAAQPGQKAAQQSQATLPNGARMEMHEVKAGTSHGKAWKILGGSVLGVFLGVYIGGMVYFHQKFLPHTIVNGIDVSYDTVEEAEKKIARQVEDYSILLEERGGSEEITAKQIGYRYVSNGEVQAFMDGRKMYLWPASFWKTQNYAFTSSTSFDEAKLDETIDALKCFDQGVEKAPTDAYMKFNGTTYELVPQKQGKKVKKKKLRKVLKKAASQNEERISLEEKGCYVKPKITDQNHLLNRTVNNMNQLAKTRVVYKFGQEQDILDGSVISKWLSYDEKGDVTLDEEKVALYVDYLAERYDTYGKARAFTTHGGNTVMVEGGKYGWLIDREAETAELIEWIKNGSRRTRIPVYAQTAVSRENSDLGESYVEVDLSGQHVWMYVDGEEIVSTDMVSGTYSNPSKRTPAGTYTIAYKKSPAVLRGYTPGDTYESPVTYWMPFNGGIGLHDANWRGSFGGDIFRYSGSHGCVNLPTWAAREIYENIYAGMPVICYY